MLTATCHCGALHITVPRRPRTLTNCNCSICRRLGALWAYYQLTQVTVQAPPEGTDDYAWGERRLRFVRCRVCGCVTHWLPLRPSPTSRMGVNARSFDPQQLGAPRIRLLDGASSWKFVG